MFTYGDNVYAAANFETR